MESINRKKHWETIYKTKELNEVSWYQPTPQTSLHFIQELKIPTTAKIIDIGGGDSFLADRLLELGYTDITVLDVSATALERAKQRLGNNASKIKWLVADAAEFQPRERYDLWHDRAAFHFLTQPKEINHYIGAAHHGIKAGGMMIIGTFSKNGPKKCSGIDIHQYSEESMTEQFKKYFEKIDCLSVDHPTPFDTTQNFIFCSFRRKN